MPLLVIRAVAGGRTAIGTKRALEIDAFVLEIIRFRTDTRNPFCRVTSGFEIGSSPLLRSVSDNIVHYHPGITRR